MLWRQCPEHPRKNLRRELRFGRRLHVTSQGGRRKRRKCLIDRVVVWLMGH
jgi:hypothetical protein